MYQQCFYEIRTSRNQQLKPKKEYQSGRHLDCENMGYILVITLRLVERFESIDTIPQTSLRGKNAKLQFFPFFFL